MAFAARFGVLRLFNPMFAELPPQFDAEDLRTMKALGAHASLPSAMVDDFESMDHASAEEKQSAAPGSLGSIPVSVISHGIRFPPPYDVMEEGWDESQARLAALSSNSELVIAERSSHMIQLEQPELVIDAIARVHAAARDGTRLARSALRAT
jgi:pimeloyl-ACP methyl ester carboxylesterase